MWRVFIVNSERLLLSVGTLCVKSCVKASLTADNSQVMFVNIMCVLRTVLCRNRASLLQEVAASSAMMQVLLLLKPECKITLHTYKMKSCLHISLVLCAVQTSNFFKCCTRMKSLSVSKLLLQ